MDTKLNVEVATMNDRDENGKRRQTISVRVEERTSGQVVTQFEMPSEEWWRVIIGSTAIVDGFLIDPAHADRLGQEQQNERVKVPSMITKAIPVTPEEKDNLLANIRQWAKNQLLDGWDELDEPYRSTDGWVIVRRRWVKPDLSSALEAERSSES